jgi:hypothetical protein
MQVPEKCHQNTVRMRNHITPQRRPVVKFDVRTNLTLPPAAGVVETLLVEPLLVEPLLLEGWAAVGAAQKEPRVAPVTCLNQIRFMRKIRVVNKQPHLDVKIDHTFFTPSSNRVLTFQFPTQSVK